MCLSRSGNVLSDQMKYGSCNSRGIEDDILHPNKGLFGFLLGLDMSQEDVSDLNETLETSVKSLYVMLHKITRYLYTQVSLFIELVVLLTDI